MLNKGADALYRRYPLLFQFNACALGFERQDYYILKMKTLGNYMVHVKSTLKTII